MYIYYDNQGILKEIINDESIRQGNSGVNEIRFFIEGAEPQIINGVYQALVFDKGWVTFFGTDGKELVEKQLFDLTTETLEIPFDKKRQLNYFKYFTKYEMFVIKLDNESGFDEIFNKSGDYGCRIQMVNLNHSIKTPGFLVFHVEMTGEEPVITKDTAITVSQWNYLIARIPETYGDEYATVDYVNEQVSEIEEVVEGKCKTIVVNDALTLEVVKSAQQLLVYYDGEDITQEVLDGDWDDETFFNTTFDSNDDYVDCVNADEGYFIFLLSQDTYEFKKLVSLNLEVGDIILITQTQVPDRWFSGEYSLGFRFYKMETTKVDINSLVSEDKVPQYQGTVTVVQNALTNINGRTLSAYEATYVSDLYPYYSITRNNEKLTKEQASNYMEYMTGSRFVPIYNYEKPQNTLFIFSDNSIWKPQYDNTNGLRLYRVNSGLVDLTTAQTITGQKTFNNNILVSNGTSGLTIENNGYTSLIEQGSGAGLSFTGTEIRPNANGTKDLGSSTMRWNDFYVKGKVDFGTKVSGRAYTAYIDLDDYDGIRFYSNNLKMMSIYPDLIYFDFPIVPNVTNTTDIGSSSKVWQNIYVNNLTNAAGEIKCHCDLLPSATDVLDLGNSTYKWQDLFLTGSVNLSYTGHARTWAITEDSYGTLTLTSTMSSSTSTYFSFQTSNFLPTKNNIDLGADNTNQKWKDFYLSGSIKLPNTDIYENQWGDLLISNQNGLIQVNSKIVPTGSTQDLGSSTQKWDYLYVNNITDGLGNTVTPEQLYYLGKAVQGLAQPNAITIGDNQTLTDLPTIYLMTNHLPVMLNGSMCYYNCEDSGAVIYTQQKYNSTSGFFDLYLISMDLTTHVVRIRDH